MAQPTGPCPVSFPNFVHPGQASPFAAPILTEHHTPALSKTILVKVLAAPQKKSMEAATQQLLDLGMEIPLLLPHHQSRMHPYGQAEEDSTRVRS